MHLVLALVIGSAQVATAHGARVQARVLKPSIRAMPTARRKLEYPAADLFAVNLDERLRFRPFDEHGRARKAAASELTHFLRCWHTGREHRVDPRLARALYQVARHYPGHRIEIFSGFRPRKYCTRAHSRHLTASAIDFHVDGVKNEALIGWLRSTFHPAGVGYYPNGVHVHLDLDRTHDTYWIDAGDAPSPDRHADAPLAEIGDTAPAEVEATSDEPVNEGLPTLEPHEPPTEDPALE
jgi:uncharacterized protein YcbK (DUF882 family)